MIYDQVGAGTFTRDLTIFPDIYYAGHIHRALQSKRSICLLFLSPRGLHMYVVNPLYNNNVCSKLSLMLKLICCYKEILTSIRFRHNSHLEKENITQMNKNAIVANVYIISISYCIEMHKASLTSNETDTCSCKRHYLITNCLTHGNNSVIMNLFSI